MIKITCNDEKKEFLENTTYYDISRAFGLGKEVLAVKVNNELLSLSDMPLNDANVNFIDVSDVSGNKLYKGALEFIFEVALKEVFPELDVTYQHSVPNGFLGKIIGNMTFTKDDLQKVKNVMARIVSDNIPFKKLNVKKKEAIMYYRKNNEIEKAENIHNLSAKVVTFYELNGIYNYFYNEMPYSTGSITNYEIVFLDNNQLVFVIPNVYLKGKLPEYVHTDNIIKAFSHASNWLENQNMLYISSINKTVGNGKIKDFIKSAELLFDTNCALVANNILQNKDVRFVLIAGPSSSGKTTTTKRLASNFRVHGYEPVIISVDDFFLERDESPRDENGNFDFECLQAIDLDLFNKTLKKLLDGEEVELPTFNFVSGKKEFNGHKCRLSDRSIVLIEGLHTLNDDLLPMIENKFKYKIYLSPFISLNIDKHNYISTLDLRLIRRIIRDNRTRGYTVNKTISAWQSVRRGEEKYIFPYIPQANVIINTAFAFEIGVLKVYVEPLLRSVDINNDYYEEARRLLNFLNPFYPISSEYVDKDTIIREFIGGNND